MTTMMAMATGGAEWLGLGLMVSVFVLLPGLLVAAGIAEQLRGVQRAIGPRSNGGVAPAARFSREHVMVNSDGARHHHRPLTTEFNHRGILD